MNLLSIKVTWQNIPRVRRPIIEYLTIDLFAGTCHLRLVPVILAIDDSWS